MTMGIGVFQPIKNKVTSLALKAQSFSSSISFQFSICSTCLSQFCFIYIHMNCSRFGILIPFSKKCGFVKDCVSFHYCKFQLLPFNLHCPSLCFCHHLHLCGLLYFHLQLCGQLFFHLNNVLLPFILLRYLCFHTNCYSTTSSYSNSSMNIESTNVVPSLVCSFAHQHFLLLCKNLIVDVLVVSIS